MDENYGYVSGGNVAIIHCVNDSCQHYALLGYHGVARIFLSHVVLLFAAVISAPPFDAAVEFSLDKHKVPK